MKDQLTHELSSNHDILYDLKETKAAATWVSQNYFDTDVIPLPEVDGMTVQLRILYLNALLISYRRCFSSGQRVRLPKGETKRS